MKMENYIPFAHMLADKAGKIIRPYFRASLAVDIKPDHSPVTIADREAEQALREIITKTFPTHGIVGEEFGEHNAAAEYVWVVDPIDGTKSFITGKPLFGTLIALTHNQTPILGVIDQPILHERWVGAVSMPSTLNNKPIRTRACNILGNAVISTTSPLLFKPQGAKIFEAVRSQCKYPTYGSDCYAYGLLATGFIDIVMESGLKPHDFCALVPVIENAGGVITDWQGQKITRASNGDILACGNAGLHAQILKLISTL